MSLINDALIKAERDRAEEAAARAAGFNTDPKFRAEKRRTSRQVQSIPLAVINACVLLACFAIVIVVLLRNRDINTDTTNTLASTPSATTDTSVDAPSSTSFADAGIATTSDLADAGSQSDSPFASAQPVETAAPPASADYELVGMSAVGSNTLIGIIRHSDQRSVWVPVGKSVSGITAVSYDADRDSAVIRVNGREHTLGLRTGPGPGPDETAVAE